MQFNDKLISQLSSNSLPSSSVPPSRQATLDEHIQQRINSELKRLHEQEQSVRQEIERALEKENLDKERGSAAEASEGSQSNSIPHSASLLQDLQELEKRTSALQKDRSKLSDDVNWKQVEINREQLVACFRENQAKPLHCKNQVEHFKQAVANLEKVSKAMQDKTT